MRHLRPTIIVHGGAGAWPLELHGRGLLGVKRAAETGFRILRRGGTSLDAAEAAIVVMEDNPVFNAGRGSTLNLLGEIETDAAIMDGKTLHGGGVALLRDIKNPIKAARIVMDKTDHVLIAGASARRLALLNGIPTSNLRVSSRVTAWRDGLRKLRSNRADYLSRTDPKIVRSLLGKSDTVGALALDNNGNLAAACSTGGVSLKLPGRIGDSAIIGAGLYADNRSGASTATGIGEQAMRLVISKAACDLMRHEDAISAATKAVSLSTKRFGLGIGLLALDRRGRYSAVHNTCNLCWAARTGNRSGQRMSGLRV